MRRKSPRVVWLPQTNANSFSPANTSAYQEFAVDLPAASVRGDFAVGEIPLTIDSQEDPLDPSTTLSDIYNSGYRLRRIVGKIWIEYPTSNEDVDIPGFLVVTAGIIIRRADEVSGQSYAFATGAANLLSPSLIENAGDPWIWRRSWLLHRRADQLTGGGLATPTCNYFGNAGGNADGPHVDQKTARIVGPEERTFLDVSITTPTTTMAAAPYGVTVVTDLRLLASLKTSTGNRRNASR